MADRRGGVIWQRIRPGWWWASWVVDRDSMNPHGYHADVYRLPSGRWRY